MNAFSLFVINLVLTLGVVSVAMYYLRHTTRRVIADLCRTEAAAEFWLRSTDVLAYSGALFLVLMFGDYDASDWVDSLRVTLVLTLVGLFVTVIVAANSIWSRAERLAAAPPKAAEK
jgi:hypothetical protein